MKHTPQIRLIKARVRRDAAEQACPHWDYESEGEGHVCCQELSEAQAEHRLARKAALRAA